MWNALFIIVSTLNWFLLFRSSTSHWKPTNSKDWGWSLNYHFGELFHLSQGTQDVSVKVHGLLPGAVRSSDQTTTARPPTLLLSFVSSAVGATTFRLGAGGPWRGATGLQQAKRVRFREWVCCSLTAGQGLGGPGECVGGPQQGCRMERGTESLGNKLTCLFASKQQKFTTLISTFCPDELEYQLGSVQGANIICSPRLKPTNPRATECYPCSLTSLSQKRARKKPRYWEPSDKCPGE